MIGREPFVTVNNAVYTAESPVSKFPESLITTTVVNPVIDEYVDEAIVLYMSPEVFVVLIRAPGSYVEVRLPDIEKDVPLKYDGTRVDSCHCVTAEVVVKAGCADTLLCVYTRTPAEVYTAKS